MALCAEYIKRGLVCTNILSHVSTPPGLVGATLVGGSVSYRVKKYADGQYWLQKSGNGCPEQGVPLARLVQLIRLGDMKIYYQDKETGALYEPEKLS